MTEQNHVKKLTLAAMFAALAFICFTYLRIEVPMGGGLSGKIYIGHAFILLSAFLLGAKYGGLSGAVGLTLADVLAGYASSAPPTFLAKFLLGWSAAVMARQVFRLPTVSSKLSIYVLSGAAGVVACVVNVITEPVIRYLFKVYALGYAEPVAYLASANCAVSMAVSAIPSVMVAVFLYAAFRFKILNNVRQTESVERRIG